MINVMIAGVGGQGTILASKLIAAAAMERKLEVRTTETIGMAQRGGSVVSHVRMGEQVFSPLIAQQTADLIIAFEPAEGARLLSYLSPRGKMVAFNGAVQPVNCTLTGQAYSAGEVLSYLKEQVKEIAVIDKGEILKQCDAKMLNVALIGASFCYDVYPFAIEDIKKVIRDKLPRHYIQPNLRALEIGYEMGRKGGRQ